MRAGAAELGTRHGCLLLARSETHGSRFQQRQVMGSRSSSYEVPSTQNWVLTLRLTTRYFGLSTGCGAMYGFLGPPRTVRRLLGSLMRTIVTRRLGFLQRQASMTGPVLANSKLGPFVR